MSRFKDEVEHLNNVFKNKNGDFDCGEYPVFNAHGMLNFMLLMNGGDAGNRRILDPLDRSKKHLQELQMLIDGNKEAEDALAGLIMTFVTATTVAFMDADENKKKRFAAAFSGLNAINQTKARAQAKARCVAEEFWSADLSQEIRVGDMADKVYQALIKDGFTKGQGGLPDSLERLKDWIRPVSPEYSRKGGRRRTPLSRIG